MTINDLVSAAYETSKNKGWWDLPEGWPADMAYEPNTGEKLMLVVTELSEAMEDYRKGLPLDVIQIAGGKPEGFPIELADAVIRIADLCGYLGIDLNTAIIQKLEYNKTRSFRHGGKRA